MHTHSLTRRELLSAAGALSVAAALPRLGHAQPRPISISHSISTFVYAQHLVAREKRFFEEEGVTADKGGPLPVTVGYCLKETIEKQPAVVQGYVNACFRAQQWIQKAPDGEILELLHKPYMDTFSRDEVLKSIQYYKGIFDWDSLVDEKQYGDVLKIFLSTKVLDAPITFAKAVDMSFARKASQRS